MCGRAPNLNAMSDPISDVGPPSRPRTMGVKDLKETYNRPLPPLRGPTLIIGSRCGCCYVPIPYVDGVTPSWSVSIPRANPMPPTIWGRSAEGPLAREPRICLTPPIPCKDLVYLNGGKPQGPPLYEVTIY